MLVRVFLFGFWHATRGGARDGSVAERDIERVCVYW